MSAADCPDCKEFLEDNNRLHDRLQRAEAIVEVAKKCKGSAQSDALYEALAAYEAGRQEGA